MKKYFWWWLTILFIMKRVIVVGYPDTFSFETEMEFPKFKYGCETRTSLLHLELEKNKISLPCHYYTDYIVEQIEVISEIELWHLGS
jgi:hypothetical protein